MDPREPVTEQEQEVQFEKDLARADFLMDQDKDHQPVSAFRMIRDRLLLRIFREEGGCSEQDAESHLWWSKFRDIVMDEIKEE